MKSNPILFWWYFIFCPEQNRKYQLALDSSLPEEKAIYEQGPELCIEKSYNLHDMENV